MTDAAELAAELCRRFEGFRSRPYLCPAGIPTVGYGATYYLNGCRVKLTDRPVLQSEADDMLLAMLERVYFPSVQRLCPDAEGAHLAALTDFAFNLGAARLAGSTLRRVYNAGNLARARTEIQKWNRGGGKVLRGLVLRRAAEAALLV